MFSTKHGVGSARSRALAKFLAQNGYNIITTKESKNNKFISRYIWLIRALLRIVFFRDKYIYLSVGPFFPLLPVAITCFIFRKKLIVDFRDPWSLNILTKYGRYDFSWELPKTLKFKIASLIEKITYRICSAFIVCTRGMKLAYAELFHDDSKLHLIQNGFDFDPIRPIQQTLSDKDSLSFICVGKFAEYNYSKAFNTIKQLIQLLYKENKEFSFIFIGCDKSLNNKIFEDLQIIDKVTFLPRMPYEEAMIYIQKSDAGITLVRNEYLEYGTKIFDYIGSGKPVWALTDKSQPFYAEFKSFLISTQNLNENISINPSAHHRDKQFQKFFEILK